MSKSRGNVVNPDEVIKEYGADSLRLFEMFMGPLEQVKPWSTAGVEGVYRFLQRIWRNLFDENDNLKTTPPPQDETTTRALHRLIKRLNDDIDRMSFNTAIAAMMEFNNLLAKAPSISTTTAQTFARLLEPFTPHFAEELHARLGGSGSISQQPWPTLDPAMLIDATIEVPVQVNGKLRSRITLPSNADESAAITAALADAEVQKFLGGKEPKKKIYVKGRMVNLVI
ncbi:MAG: class I tRNA ligase family protein [Phycisphaerales bacterium]|nr:class I tRNA ligase family protein [Phycisphaerales bacterium]